MAFLAGVVHRRVGWRAVGCTWLRDAAGSGVRQSTHPTVARRLAAGRCWAHTSVVPRITPDTTKPAPPQADAQGGHDTTGVGSAGEPAEDVPRPVVSIYTGHASPEREEGSTTHFGFKTVDAAAKEDMVGQIFSRVAAKYDLMNDLMSAGMHREWKDAFVEYLGPFVSKRGSTRVLDVAGGTGDTAFRIVESARRCAPTAESLARCEVVVADINPDMLAEGHRRAEGLGLMKQQPAVSFVEANAEVLPFDDVSMDVYTITFGIRNVTDINAALREAYRVLKPGGRFMCLEFSHVIVPVLDDIYNAYSFHVIPWIGEVVAGDRDSYQYLVESIRRFPDQDKFASMLSDAGFQMVTHHNFTGGVVALHSGFKPLS